MAEDELKRYLDSLEREDGYHVEAVLKESPVETTQLVVYRDSAGVESGPYIRKFIKRDSGMGSAYERIYASEHARGSFRHLPHIHDCYAREDDLVVVMENVEGETLQDLVYRLDPSLELARAVFPKICEAVIELHEGFERPLIHRDLKPSNIIVQTVEGQGAGATFDVVLIDFGIARQFKDGAETDTVHFGTRAFAPPEQYGFGQTSVSSDVYALGMLLYFCLTEQIPTSQQREAGFPDLAAFGQLQQLVIQATRFDPTERFASVRAFANAFDAATSNDLGSGAVRPGVNQKAESPAAAPSPMPTHVQGAPQNQAQNLSDTAAKPANVQMVGRVWNAIVAVCFLALFVYMLFLAATGGMKTHTGQPFEPWQTAAAVVIDTALFASVAFACLDKRRLRERFPALKSLKAWQPWLVAALIYAFAAALNAFVL